MQRFFIKGSLRCHNFFGSLLLMVLLLIGGVGQALANPGPVIFIQKPTFNAGKVVEGSPITHTFILLNKGDENLLIKNVKPG